MTRRTRPWKLRAVLGTDCADCARRSGGRDASVEAPFERIFLSVRAICAYFACMLERNSEIPLGIAFS